MDGTLPITHVMVHPDGARVTRAGPVRVERGEALIRALPLLLDERSIRVEVTGGTLTRARLDLDVSLAEREAQSGLETALIEAERALAALDARKAALQAQRAALSQIVPASPDEDPRHVPSVATLTGWVALQAALRDWSTAIDDALHALAPQIERANATRNVAAVALREASTEATWRRWAPTRRLAIAVDVDAEVQVTVSYVVPGARWAPSYVLHTDRGFRAGKLVMRALVVQRTGEDWSRVALSLATAPCRRAVTLPELPALRLGTRQPFTPGGWRDLPPDLDALFPELAPAPAPEPQPVFAHPGPRDEDADDDLEIYDATTQESSASSWDEAPRAKMAFRRAPPPSPAPGAMPAPMAAPMAAAMPSMPPRRAAAATGGAPGRPPAPPGGLEVEADALDYPRLRLAPFDAPRGVRGRLRPASLADAADLPAPAKGRLDEALRANEADALGVTRRPLPPQHVLPGPLEGIDHRWDAVDTVDVRSVDRFHSVAVRTFDLGLDVRYRVVPRHDPRAFRIVRATLSTPVPLPPGPVEVLVDGASELTTPWAGSAGGADLRLDLGVEDGLKIARNVRYREESAGLFGNDRRLHTEVDVQIASAVGRAVEVEVLERTPVPGGDGVTVDLVASSPTAEAWTGEPEGPILKGAWRQVVKVPAGATATATLHSTVTLGSKVELAGGDRRG